MARNLPVRAQPALAFLEARIDAWAENPEAIGLTGEQVAALDGEIQSVRQLLTTAHELRAQSISATTAFKDHAEHMHDRAASMILAIKSFANNSTLGGGGGGGDPSEILASALLSPREPNTSPGRPDAPTNVQARLRNGGTVQLKWEGSLANRTFFEIHRRLDDEQSLTHIASVGCKEFIDAGIPEGTFRATYSICAIRGRVRSLGISGAVVQLGSAPIEGERTRAA